MARAMPFLMTLSDARANDAIIASTNAAMAPLLGDERVTCEADRVLLVRRDEPLRECGCTILDVTTLKDRSGPAKNWQLSFWGARFYPALGGEGAHP